MWPASLTDPFRRMLDFRGRARRREYWLFVAWQVPVLLGAFLIASMVTGTAGKVILLPEVMLWGLAGYVAVFGLPVLALQVRRLHDSDKSGWWALVGFLPYLGPGWLIFLMAEAGTWGPNRFGPDPRHADWDGDLFE